MKATFVNTNKGTWAYIQKSVRVNGHSTTKTVKRLGLLEDIKRNYGCEDPRQWVIDMAVRMTEEERSGKEVVSIEFYPGQRVSMGESPLRIGGDLFVYPFYSKLGLPQICDNIKRQSRIKYDLDEVLKTLVAGRLLFPGSKAQTYARAASLVKPPKFSEEEMYRALSLLAPYIDDIQAKVYANSFNITRRKDRIIYYDCTNYYFEIEDNDRDFIDTDTGEYVTGLRKRGKSKENRPNPIVQLGMFMDMGGIPLAFVVFPGNESEQTTLRPLEEVLDRKFGMTEYIVSTDAGLGSEQNRRYNMGEGRDYICVQSLPSLKEQDRVAATDPKGWHIAYAGTDQKLSRLSELAYEDDLFCLDQLRSRPDANDLLRNVTFYKEITVYKESRQENQQWTQAKKLNPDATPTDSRGKRIPRHIKSMRQERIIVTYSHDFDIYLKHKRAERLAIAQKIVTKGDTKARRSQQSPLNYIEPVHKTSDGQIAIKTELVINDDILAQEELLDGFYAYATSLDDDATLVLKARSFHHEIEHLFRTTKTHLDARPVHLSRQDRIKSHFLVCFLALLILKLIHHVITRQYEQDYAEYPLSVDSLVNTLREIKFGEIGGRGYIPMYRRTTLTDQLQDIAGVEVNNQIITKKRMNEFYRKVNKS